RTAHACRARDNDGRSDAAVLGARGEVLGSGGRWRSAAVDAAGRKADRVPRPVGARPRDGSSLSAPLRVACLWSERAGRPAVRLSWLAVRRGWQLYRHAEPDAGSGFPAEGAREGIQGL